MLYWKHTVWAVETTIVVIVVSKTQNKTKSGFPFKQYVYSWNYLYLCISSWVSFPTQGFFSSYNPTAAFLYNSNSGTHYSWENISSPWEWVFHSRNFKYIECYCQKSSYKALPWLIWFNFSLGEPQLSSLSVPLV